MLKYQFIQQDLDITNLYILKSSIEQTIFPAPVIVKYSEKTRYKESWLKQTYFAKPLTIYLLKVPLCTGI